MAFDFPLITHHFKNLAIAYALALPIGWERERAESGAGLRTFPLVAIASCGFMLLADAAFPGDPDAKSRVIQGVITGMGFIGGGAILKQHGTVSGTATAASIWNTGVLGMAVALERYEVAIVLSVVNFITLRWMLPFKNHLTREKDGEL